MNVRMGSDLEVLVGAVVGRTSGAFLDLGIIRIKLGLMFGQSY